MTGHNIIRLKTLHSCTVFHQSDFALVHKALDLNCLLKCNIKVATVIMNVSVVLEVILQYIILVDGVRCTITHYIDCENKRQKILYACPPPHMKLCYALQS